MKNSEKTSHTGAKIVVIGVGGGGGNMVNYMVKQGIENIHFIIANTDIQVLDKMDKTTVLRLGEKLTRGLGAGMKPEIGRESALENANEIREAVAGADIVFIATGLGGGTGTGASPIVANIAREANALTISVVTTPFAFEGRKRKKLAEAGLEALKAESDSIVVVPNDRLLHIVDRKMGMKDSFELVDSVLSRAVLGTSGIILSTGEDDINLDFADLKTVMSHRGKALMGIGESKEEQAAIKAMESAIKSPLLDNISIDGAMGILVHFHMHPNYPMIDLSEAMVMAEENADEDAEVIFGTTTDSNLDENYIKVTLIATGFEKDLNSETKDTYLHDKVNSYKSGSLSQNIERAKEKSETSRITGGEVDDEFLDLPSIYRQD